MSDLRYLHIDLSDPAILRDIYEVNVSRQGETLKKVLASTREEIIFSVKTAERAERHIGALMLLDELLETFESAKLILETLSEKEKRKERGIT